MTTGEVKTFHIDDRVEVVEFEGSVIGHSSSRKRGSTHWTEITFYRTTGGNFIYHSAGHSLVYHRLDRDCSRGQEVTGLVIENDDQAEPCNICSPEPWPDNVAVKDLRFMREITLSDVQLIEDRIHLRNMMYQNKGGVRTVSSLATAALEEALSNDELFREMVQPKDETGSNKATRRIS